MKDIKQVHVQHFTVQSAFSTQRSGVYRVQIGGQHHCQVQQVHTVHYGASTVECTQKSPSSLLSWGVGVRGHDALDAGQLLQHACAQWHTLQVRALRHDPAARHECACDMLIGQPNPWAAFAAFAACFILQASDLLSSCWVLTMLHSTRSGRWVQHASSGACWPTGGTRLWW